jgi:hypothetical protein
MHVVFKLKFRVQLGLEGIAIYEAHDFLIENGGRVKGILSIAFWIWIYVLNCPTLALVSTHADACLKYLPSGSYDLLHAAVLCI